MDTTTCPYCGRENDSHASTDDPNSKPSEGDVSICYKCRNIGIFTEEGVRKASPEEDTEIRSHQNIQDALLALDKALGPLQAVDILRHAHEWQAARLHDHTGEETDGI
jgi:hypothetical protein